MTTNNIIKLLYNFHDENKYIKEETCAWLYAHRAPGRDWNYDYVSNPLLHRLILVTVCCLGASFDTSLSTGI